MTRDQFIYALTACGCLLKDGKTWYEHNELIKCFEDLGLFEQEPILDKIRAEIIELRSRQNVGVLECLDIIDKYKAEAEEAEEIEAHPINENIAKGFEEFTKMMFKQGQAEREKRMTRADKFEEIFGYRPATNRVLCNEHDLCDESDACKYCSCNYSNHIGREEDWWNAEYKENKKRGQ